ncbi:GxxExxY protein [Rhodohalobacter sp.]|uniref:GxxExxY protein n=1 Tax=Rhodohalobacter sp. TaxID=1974210 RepID=UPI002ACED7D5|nr:GxxExxY protein [Rhodohalobacter sp.]MDZ7758477.1 GxxExxY protein [Rhodohalobacter sp.]
MTENEISKVVLDCAFKVHSQLGPGLLESAYQECLYYEINKSGLSVQKEVPLPLTYEEVQLEIGYRIDLLVENKFIVEIKSVDSISDVHLAQVLTYLKLSKIKLGFLLNFNVSRLKSGIKRIINGQLTS